MDLELPDFSSVNGNWNQFWNFLHENLNPAMICRLLWNLETFLPTQNAGLMNWQELSNTAPVSDVLHLIIPKEMGQKKTNFWPKLCTFAAEQNAGFELSMPSLLWEFLLLLSIDAFYVGYDHLKFILKVWKNCESCELFKWWLLDHFEPVWQKWLIISFRYQISIKRLISQPVLQHHAKSVPTQY